VKERLEAQKAKKPKDAAKEPARKHSLPLQARSLLDALILAYVIAMFIRSFVFELFMIPTGSMTPTLIGDSAGEVAFVDYNGDGVDDVVYTMGRTIAGGERALQIFLMNHDGSYRELLYLDNVSPTTTSQLARSSRRRTDFIVVNKFSYWFSNPDRGDVAVFKVPDRPAREGSDRSIFEPTKPVYIKRVVGLPGETITVLPASAHQIPLGSAERRGTMFGGTEFIITGTPLLVNGQPAPDDSLAGLVHFPPPRNGRFGDDLWAAYREVRISSGDEGILLMGDNSTSSLDSRYWGALPLSHLRGRAVLRYWPWSSRRLF
jgi:signal peptidase I